MKGAVVTLGLEEFQFIRTFLQQESAIQLDDEKQYLVESRLQPLARREGFDTVGELVFKLRANKTGVLRQKVVEAMTTHETSFFRDIRPFEALKLSVLPKLIAARAATRELRIWCMACSTGQEPYSLALLLRENFPELQSWKVKILATDLSMQVLEKAKAGVFNQLEVNRGLPTPMLMKYFQRQGMNWQINDAIRQMIDFQPMNLIEQWPLMPPIDVVLLRNVLIYFDIETKKSILSRVRQRLRPDGYLFLGGAENTFNLDDGFERVELERSSVYRMRRLNETKD